MGDGFELLITMSLPYFDRIKVASLDDSTIIDALSKHPGLPLRGGYEIIVSCSMAGYRQTFHITETRVFNITPF